MRLPLHLPMLRPDQWAIAQHPARIKCVAMGRRWGKTTLAGCISLAAAVYGAKCAWWVPTYKNARPVWRWVEAATGGLLKAKGVELNRTERYLRFPSSGGSLSIFSADNDVAGRGDWFNLAVLDEGARIAETTWTDVIQPSLADADGDAIIPSTPAGKNWFWVEWRRGLEQMDAEIASFTAPSSANPNPHIQRAALLAKGRVPERTYLQEWLAQFIEDGQVFRRVQEAATAQRQTKSIDGHTYAMGVDLARRVDFTVCAVIDVTTNELVELDRFNQVDWSVQLGRIRALAARYGVERIVVDQSGVGDYPVEQLQRDLGAFAVTGYLFTPQTKTAAIEALALAFEQEQVRILNHPILIGELLAYEAERTASGHVRYNAPIGLHDDCVIALALAWQAAGGAESAHSEVIASVPYRINDGFEY